MYLITTPYDDRFLGPLEVNWSLDAEGDAIDLDSIYDRGGHNLVRFPALCGEIIDWLWATGRAHSALCDRGA